MSEPGPLGEFHEVMRRLRSECSWKAAQTHRSLARYLLEETHEVLEALDTGDAEHLREELGDLLLQIYFHAVIAEEAGEFTLDDVARDVIAKMHRRNPHVFAPEGGELAPGGDPAAVNDAWQAIKAGEKPRGSVLDGIPPGLPALLLADKVLERLERAGVPPVRPVVEQPVVEEVAQQPSRNQPSRNHDPATTLGDRLLALVAEARADGLDPEQALRDAVRRALPPGA